MLFKPDLIEKIVSGEKTATRRIVKEGEKRIGNGIEVPISTIYTDPSRIKWQVGKDYAVQPKRGAKCVWWCRKTKQIKTDKIVLSKEEKEKRDMDLLIYDYAETERLWQPLRIRITRIEKQKLLDVTEEEGKKEGFLKDKYSSASNNFLNYFWKINNKHPKEDWNPDVWVLEFEVVK